MLNSYHLGLECTDKAIEGVSSVFHDSKLYKVFMEYMDTKRIPYNKMERPVFEYLREKYAALPPDVIVVSDNNAFEFMKSHRDELFPGVPVVFCGVNNYSPAMLEGFAHATGVAETVASRETLETAKRLQPSLKRVVLVMDATSTSQDVLEEVQRQTSGLDWLRLETLRGMELADIKQRLASLEPDDAVLLLPYYLSPSGRSYQPEESLAEIRAVSKAPIYSLWGSEIGKGVLGGKVVDMRKAGEAAGVMAKRILTGTPAESVQVVRQSPHTYLFDYNELDRFGFPKDVLPSESHVLNAPSKISKDYPVFFWGSVSLCVLLLLNVFVLIRNMHSLKTTKQRFTQSEKRFEGTVNNLIDGYFFADMHGAVLAANPSCVGLFGHERLEEMLHQDIFPILFSSLQKRESFLEDIRREGVVLGLNTVLKRQDGRMIDIEANCVLVCDSAGSPIGVEGVVRDITERNMIQKELERFNVELEDIVEERTAELLQRTRDLEAANKRLLALDELKTTFLTTVSHELRTPLTSVLGFAKLIRKDLRRIMEEGLGSVSGKGLARAINNLGIIEKEGGRLTRLIEDFLDLSRIESGKAKWHDTENDLKTLVNHAVDALRAPLAAKPEIELVVDIEETLPSIIIDGDRLVQVLVNLLGNAAKFTDNGRISLMAAMLPDGLEVQVADTGNGFPESNRDNLFSKFYQVSQDDMVRRGLTGSGLGLAICKEIIERYGGTIWAESEVGSGSSFTFRLPLSLFRHNQEAQTVNDHAASSLSGQ